MIPVFVGGTGRSGTSILKKLLVQHPNMVGVTGELRVIIDPGGALDLVNALSRDWTPYKADNAIQTFRRMMVDAAHATISGRAMRKLMLRIGASPRRYVGLDLATQFGSGYYQERLDRLTRDLTYHVARGSWMGSPSYQLHSKIYEADPLAFLSAAGLIIGFFEDLYSKLAERQKVDATHWLDDTPYNVLRAEMLVKVFPGMKLIHIHRDPRDVLASYLQQNWGGDDMVATARRLGNILTVWRDIRERLPGDSYLEVSFEELARSPQEQLARIVAFVKLSSYQFSEEELAIIDYKRAHIGRWKNEIPSDSLPHVEKYLGSHFHTFGYSF